MSYRLQQKRIKRALTRLQNRGLEITITPMGVVIPDKPKHKSPCRLRRDARRLAQFGPRKGSPHLRHAMIYGAPEETSVSLFATVAERDSAFKAGGLDPKQTLLLSFVSEYEAMEYKSRFETASVRIGCAEE